MQNGFGKIAAAALLTTGAMALTACAAPSHSTCRPHVATKKKPVQAKPVKKLPRKEVPPVLNFSVKSLDGKDVDLSKYAGKAVLIVNTASKCGFTPQYAGLQKLHETYAAQGLAVVGFPANDFGQQEPGSNEEIIGFCQKNFGVKFDMMSKVQVTGDGKTPLYKFLTDEKTNPQSPGEVKWNFEKFLIGRDGKILQRFRSDVKPESDEMKTAIEAALKG